MTSDGRDEEARRVEPERGRRAEGDDEDAAERRAEELRSLLDAGAHAGRALHADVGELDDVGEQRGACRRSRGVEERADEHERHQLPDLDPDRRVEQRDRRDGCRAREVGDDTRPAESEAVDDDTAEERRKHDREEVEEDDERGERRAPGRRQHVPGDRDLRDGVAGERDGVRGVERVEGRPLLHRRAERAPASAAVAPAHLREHGRERHGRGHGRDGRSAPYGARVGTAPSLQSAALMNVVVYVSDALRTDHLGCYGARYVNTRTIDELAAGGVRYAQAISSAPWTAPSTTSIVTGLYAHHHGYLHWDATLDPSRRDDLPRVLRSRLRGRKLRLRHELPLQGPARGERPRHVGDARRRVRVHAREPREAVPAVRPQLGDAHAVRHRPRRPQELARGEAGGDRRHPVRLRVGARGDARGVPEGGRAPVGGARRLVPRGARVARSPRVDDVRVPLRPRRVVGRALRGQGGREGRLPHARRDALRRDRPGAADPLGAGAARARRRRVAGAHGRSHADAPRARRAARPRDGRRVAPAASTATGRP